MWRNISKQLSSEATRFSFGSSPFSRTSCFLRSHQNPMLAVKLDFRRFHLNPRSNYNISEFGFPRFGDSSTCQVCLGTPTTCSPRNQTNFHGFSCIKSYVSVAQAISSINSEEDSPGVDKIQDLLQKMTRDEGSLAMMSEDGGLGNGVGTEKALLEDQGKENKRKFFIRQFHKLRSRQVKVETEAWEQAANEYKKLLKDMCAQKLAPNLPYMKSLFLGWFEPLRDAILKDQEICRQGKSKAAYLPYLDQLPAEMMSVITMHKTMALVMAAPQHGSVRVVRAACLIGEAIEQEIKIHSFLEKTKKKRAGWAKKTDVCESENASQEQDKLRKKVTDLMKKQKLKAVRQIVRREDGSRSWNPDARAKVGCRLIELLTQTAFIQPPASQMADGLPDIRPAFVHTMANVLTRKNNVNSSKRSGVIECDPLVVKGLERAARFMVIPYMPMLVPPVNWTGYDRGVHLCLPSYFMRTHGAKHQREAITRTPKQQLKPVFEALNMLGNTKWRINKWVLSVVDRLWASGGRIADLVDRMDVPLPEKPDTEDATHLKKWKWKAKYVSKENAERHSQCCDVELNLSVARKMKDEAGFFLPTQS